MAAPNIVNVTNINGSTSIASLTTSSADIVSNSAASGKVYKINTLLVSNVSASNTDVTVEFKKPLSTVRLAYQITVPTKSTLVVISKDTSIYLEEGDSIGVLASANSALEATCSYEVIN